MTKPSVLLVPASYCLLSIYQPLIDAVSQAGYEIKGIHLPTIGPRSREGQPSTAPSMYDDAAAIAHEVEKLADQGKDVVLIGHSYAGIPMSQCAKSLSKTERTQKGQSGGIVHLAYLAALVPPQGGSAASLLGGLGEGKRPAVSIDEHGWMLMEDPAGTARMICQDLSAEDGEALVRGFAKHSAQSFANELTHAGYRDIPTSYLLCEQDHAGPPDFQREMIATIEKGSNGRQVDVTSIDAGHMANASQEKETNEWILTVLKKLEGS